MESSIVFLKEQIVRILPECLSSIDRKITKMTQKRVKYIDRTDLLILKSYEIYIDHK